MEKNHNLSAAVHLDSAVLQSWTHGHPNFSSFNISDKVIKKIHKSGNSVNCKFSQNFDGPFIVTKIHSNGVSYDMVRESRPDKIIKANHRQLRPWREIPDYIRKFIDNSIMTDHEEEIENQRTPNLCLLSSDCDGSGFSGFSSSETPSVTTKVKSPARAKQSDSDNNVMSESGDTSVAKDAASEMDRGKVAEDSVTDIDCSDAEKIITPKSISDLTKFSCTEIVVHEEFLHSSPIDQQKLKFRNFLKQVADTDDFFALEQTLNVHEEALNTSEQLLGELSKTLTIIEDGTTDILNKSLIRNINSSILSGESSHIKNRPDSNEFGGFSAVACKQSALILKDMKSIIATSKRNLEAGRSRGNSIRRDLWSYRQNREEFSSFASMEGSSFNSIIGEMSDYVPEIVSRPSPVRHRYQLRSRNSTAQLPSKLSEGN